MSEPFLAEIRIMGFTFAPRGWAQCDGQILPINQNQSLYSLLGTTYGGDGRTSFALPDLRSRTPIHVGAANGPSRTQGERGGAETVTLSTAQMPQHTHTMRASADAGSTGVPSATTVLASSANQTFHEATNLVTMHASTVATAGASQAHENMMPFTTLNFCIALQGLFPSRN